MRQVRVVPLALAALLATAAGAPTRAENVVRWATLLQPSGLDPHAFGNQQTFAVLTQMFEHLVDTDWRMNVEPALATRWSLVSPTVWRIELRPGVTFHDGEPLAAEDVVFSLNRARSVTSASADYLLGVASVEAPDEHTVLITTQAPDLVLPYRLTNVEILSRRWLEAHDLLTPDPSGPLVLDVAAWRGAGTGPFMLESLEPGERLVLARNPRWWGAVDSKPVDRIEQIVVASQEAAGDLLLKGEADFFATQQAPPGLLERLEVTPGIAVKRAESANTQYLGFNLERDELRSSSVKARNPFKDRRVREAIYRAIDFKGIRDALGGLAAPAGMIVGKSASGWSPELDRSLPYDPDRARQLLGEAGYPQGFDVTLDCPTSREAACRFYVRELAQIGIKVESHVIPGGELDRMMQTHESDFFQWGSFEALDSASVLRAFYHSGVPYAAPGVASPELDAFIEAAETEPATYVRDALSERLWKQVLDDIVYVPLYRIVNAWVMRSPLDLPMGANQFPQFRLARAN